MDTFRRNACPSLAAPMRTGDGWLARLPPLVAPMTPAMLAELSAAADRHGNGLLEISKRGNLQLRGLAEDGAGGLAADLEEAGFDLAEGIPISLDPLATLAGIDAAPIVHDLHRRIQDAGVETRLAPKFTILLDFGSPLAPQGLSADLRLAFRGDRVAIGLGGDDARAANWIGWVARTAAIDAALAILGTLAAHGPGARLRGPGGLAGNPAIASTVAGLFDGAVPPANGAAGTTIGPIAGYDVSVQGIAFAFGQSHADALRKLAATASREGLAAFAPAPERVLLLAGEPDAVAATVSVAARLGFITEPNDTRRFIAACIGSEGCASGRMAARHMAEAAAGAIASLLDGSLTLHLSGCAKGCAHPEPAKITLVGVDNGAGLVLDGRARDAPVGIAPASVLLGGLGRLAAMAATRAPGTTARAAVDSMERAGILGAVTGETAGDDDDRGESRNDPRDARLSA
ncbi:MAG: precorrin-3B synthase [Bosea sp.]|nr:precorrin-3B synthase [Bosea sp. (in: a-proteobacteria)]